MQLIGMLDSPFVRRVAVSAQFLGIPYEHDPISIFDDYEKFRGINPLVKVPTLVLDDGRMLVDSTLIIAYLESTCGDGRNLMPQDDSEWVRALQVIGVAMVAMEKTVGLIYERTQRPKELQHAPWIERIDQQLRGAVDQLESYAGDGSACLFGPDMTQADISLAIAWRFVQHVTPRRIPAADYPGLVQFSLHAEEQAEFMACPLS